MKYTQLTIVTKLQEPPKPGEFVTTDVREVGCFACVVDIVGKLKPCILHHRERILWASTVERDDIEAEVEVNDLG